MTGSALYTILAQEPANTYAALCDSEGFVLSGKFDTIGSPSTTPGIYQTGCLMVKSDQTFGQSPLFVNEGTVASPSWASLVAGASGINQLTGDVLAGPGAGSQPSTVVAWRGVQLDATSFKLPMDGGSLFTNGIPMYSGNTGVGWIVAERKSATASSGVATMPGANNGTNDVVTTESLTTAPGATTTLQIIDGQLTSSTAFQYNVRRGTSTQGIPYVVSYTQTGGSVTFTIMNIDPALPFNGTLIMNVIGL